ncbi:rod shape-determining protein RodA [Thermocrinis albus DSM 14484]|uniref:Cell wall polymerase n=1 Tax=Thermocrinis albus (strain DSM 14484 / JCM 11386 / HI 11/12) TaxID=638303 RepID=D3SPN0_THEAH|nr:rod shape-determining protein RodA [Thermocrinis albus]ADC89117.1 rod shape-determining protein RodA [Thermocrinis albus DSM 14484]
MVKNWKNAVVDLPLTLSVILIMSIGLLGVYSATYGGTTSPMFVKQVLYQLMGIFLILLLARVPFHVMVEYAPVVYAFNLLLLVMVPLVGKTVYGAKRWIDIGPVHIQPSEFMKFSLVLLSAYALGKMDKLFQKDLLLLVVLFTIPFVLVFHQPDLGTSMVYWAIFAFALFFRGLPVRYFALAGLLLILFLPFGWHLLKDYQKERILAVLDPHADYSGSGYQLIQSIIAIGSGEFLGKGFLKGTQSHLLFLPEKHTDFIFSVIAEEWGFWMSALLVSLFFLIILRLITYVPLTLDMTERVFLGTASGLLLFQVSINLLMTMGMFPVVGMPLPFVSYGGSSIITFGLLLGVCLSLIKELKTRQIIFERG